MTRGRLGLVMDCVRAWADVRAGAEASDAQLVEQFDAAHNEAAFESLMRRHGGMVFGM
jgi:hypothetical protein